MSMKRTIQQTPSPIESRRMRRRPSSPRRPVDAAGCSCSAGRRSAGVRRRAQARGVTQRGHVQRRALFRNNACKFHHQHARGTNHITYLQMMSGPETERHGNEQVKRKLWRCEAPVLLQEEQKVDSGAHLRRRC
jgi:hypothetical protein